MFARSCLEANRRLWCAVGFGHNAFAIHAAVNDDDIGRAHFVRRPGDCLPGLVRSTRAVITGLRILLRYFVSGRLRRAGQCQREAHRVMRVR